MSYLVQRFKTSSELKPVLKTVDIFKFMTVKESRTSSNQIFIL